MEISQLQNLPMTVRAGTTTIAVERLEPGQLLRAVVEAMDGQGRATLRIGPALLSADMDFAVRPGDKLTLQVVRTGQQPVLEPVIQDAASDLRQALRALLPRQAPLPPLLQRLAGIARQPERTALPPEIVRQVRKLVENLIEADRIREPGRLRNALRQSGNFLDTRLLTKARGGHSRIPAADLHAGLLRLKQALQSATDKIAETSASGRHKLSETLPASAPGNNRPTASGMPMRADDSTVPMMRLPQARLTRPGTDGPSNQTQTAEAARAGHQAAATMGMTAGYDMTTSTPRDSSIAMLIRHLMPKPQSRAQVEDPSELRQQELLNRLLQDTDKAIARTRFNQLASRHAESDNRQVWLLELPVRKDDGIDLFQLRIQRERNDGHANRQHEPRWSIDLAFELAGIGPVHARVRLHEGRIGTTLWLADTNGLDLFREHVHELHGRLTEAGLQVAELKLLPGRPVEEQAGNNEHGPLVDFEA